MIQDEFLKFFKNLIGSSTKKMPSVNVKVIRDGPTLSLQHQQDMLRDIRDEEITKALHEHPNNKEAGIDGFPVEFSKQTRVLWEVKYAKLSSCSSKLVNS